MENRKSKQALNITFHNPNSKEATVKALTKIFAQEFANRYIMATYYPKSVIQNSEFSL